jgi:hypothetical protein
MHAYVLSMYMCTCMFTRESLIAFKSKVFGAHTDNALGNTLNGWSSFIFIIISSCLNTLTSDGMQTVKGRCQHQVIVGVQFGDIGIVMMKDKTSCLVNDVQAVHDGAFLLRHLDLIHSLEVAAQQTNTGIALRKSLV